MSEQDVALSQDDFAKSVANAMLDVYINSTNEEGQTSYKGLLILENIMDDVPDELRAAVFISFIEILKINEIDFDPLAFQRSPSKAVH